MDFKTTEAADELGGLARTITESVCTAEHQRELDGLEQRFDRDLWGKLIEADILSTAEPESLGGGGFGVLQQEWAMPAINGEKIIAVALDGEMGQGPVQATASGDGYRLTGSRTQVGYGPVADAFLVPAGTDSGTKIFLIAKDDAGATVTALDTTGRGSVGHLELQGVEASRVVGGDDAVGWLTTHGALGRKPPAARLAELHNVQGSTPANESSSIGRSAASRPSPRDWPTATSTSRDCG